MSKRVTMTMYFHELPVEIEQHIFKLAHQIEAHEKIEHEYDTFVRATDERRSDFWKGRYSQLKLLAKQNGVKCKGAKYIVDHLFVDGKCPNFETEEYDVSMMMISNIISSWEKVPVGSARVRCISHMLDKMTVHIEFIKLITPMRESFKERLDVFKAKGNDVQKYIDLLE